MKLILSLALNQMVIFGGTLHALALIIVCRLHLFLVYNRMSKTKDL